MSAASSAETSKAKAAAAAAAAVAAQQQEQPGPTAAAAAAAAAAVAESDCASSGNESAAAAAVPSAAAALSAHPIFAKVVAWMKNKKPSAPALPNHSLGRFISAQDGAAHHTPLTAAMKEIATTGKQSCWIWYVAPQLLDPGRSSANNTLYQLHGQVEIVAYLLHDVLAPRQRAFFALVRQQLEAGKDPTRLMGMSVDLKKLHHSCTSFFFGCASLLEEDERAAGSLSKVVGEQRWSTVVAIHHDTSAIIDCIARKPYPIKSGAAFPRHDPPMIEKWAKSESWVHVPVPATAPKSAAKCC